MQVFVRVAEGNPLIFFCVLALRSFCCFSVKFGILLSIRFDGPRLFIPSSRAEPLCLVLQGGRWLIYHSEVYLLMEDLCIKSYSRNFGSVGRGCKIYAEMPLTEKKT